MKIQKYLSVALLVITILSIAVFVFANYLSNDNLNNELQLKDISGKLLIVVDMEGVSGISMDEYWFSIKGHPLYFLKRRFLVNEVNAAITGALNAGLNEKDIIVADIHLTHYNLTKNDLPQGIEIIREIDTNQIGKKIEKIFLIGFHASADTPARYGHSFSYMVESIRKNEEEIGETNMWAYVAGSLNIPIALATGDSYAISELRLLDNECNCIVNKEPNNTTDASTILKQIEKAAESGIRNPRKSIIAPEPFQIEIKFKSDKETIVLEAPNSHLVLGKLNKLLKSINEESPVHKLINFFTSTFFLVIVILLGVTSAMMIYSSS